MGIGLDNYHIIGGRTLKKRMIMLSLFLAAATLFGAPSIVGESDVQAAEAPAVSTQPEVETPEKFAVTINIKKYGAKNKKDCTKAFQKALDKASKRGNAKKKGRVIVPAGTWYLKGTLQISSNVYIQCDKKAKIVKKASNFAYMLRSKIKRASGYNGIKNVTVEGGVWDAGYRKYSSTVGGSNMCFVHGSNLTFKDITLRRNYSTHLIELVGVKDATITGCKMYGYKGYSKLAKKEAIQLDIVHSTKVISRGDKYDDTVCKNITIKNNEVYSYPRAVGTHSSVKGVYNDNIVIEDNNFHDLSADAIYLFNFINVSVRNNVMKNVGKGVVVKSSGDTLYNRRNGVRAVTLPGNDYNIWIENNVITANKSAGAFGSIIGIHAVGEKNKYIGGIHVSNNTVSSSGELGIYLSYVRNSSVEGNKCRKKMKIRGTGNNAQADCMSVTN